MPDTITCPNCGMTSTHPQDIEHGYCGHCHEFTGIKIMPPTVKQLGEPRKDATWTLMPTAADVCSQCGKDHEPDQPHDAQSMHYQYAHFAEHGRWPNWADAMAHCSTEVQDAWINALRRHGVPEEQLTREPDRAPQA